MKKPSPMKKQIQKQMPEGKKRTLQGSRGVFNPDLPASSSLHIPSKEAQTQNQSIRKRTVLSKPERKKDSFHKTSSIQKLPWASRLAALLERPAGFSKGNLHIQLEEIQAFVQIRQGGLSLSDCLLLCFQDGAAMLEKLEQGESLACVLCATKNKSVKRLQYLLPFMSLEDALETLLGLMATREQLEKTILSQAAYPVFLMAFSYGMLWFFYTSILPAMAAYGPLASSWLLASLLGIFTLLWAGMGLFGLLYGLVFYTPFSRPWMQKLVFSIHLIQKIHTCQFARLLEKMLQSGLSTRDCLEGMSQMTFHPFACRMAQTWKESLQKGISLNDCALKQKELDPEFRIFLKTGLQSARLLPLLKTYQNHCMSTLHKRIHRLCLYIQLFSYGCVGALVISVYQVLFVPLQMLEGF